MKDKPSLDCTEHEKSEFTGVGMLTLNWNIFNGVGGDFGVTNIGGKNVRPLESLGFQQ